VFGKFAKKIFVIFIAIEQIRIAIRSIKNVIIIIWQKRYHNLKLIGFLDLPGLNIVNPEDKKTKTWQVWPTLIP
jgi:hypothetical protein